MACDRRRHRRQSLAALDAIRNGNAHRRHSQSRPLDSKGENKSARHLQQFEVIFAPQISAAMSKPTLYYALFSPPARACMITAKLIGLDVDLKFVDFSQKEHLSEEFLRINPQHQIPVFVDVDGEVYIDSHAIICFMVGKYAKDDKLYPKDLKQRAHVDHRLHFENGVLFQVIKDIVSRNIYGGEGEFNAKTITLCENAYSFLEAFLKNAPYVVGNEMTVADVSINTTLITLDLLLPVNAEKYPNVKAWMERMKSLPDYQDVNVKGAEALCTRILGVMKETRESQAQAAK